MRRIRGSNLALTAKNADEQCLLSPAQFAQQKICGKLNKQLKLHVPFDLIGRSSSRQELPCSAACLVCLVFLQNHHFSPVISDEFSSRSRLFKVESNAHHDDVGGKETLAAHSKEIFGGGGMLCAGSPGWAHHTLSPSLWHCGCAASASGSAVLE